MTKPDHPSLSYRFSPRADSGPFTFRGGPLGCLLIHGRTGTPEEMKYLGDRLNRDHGFTVHGVLLAGHGKDSQEFERKGWPEWYQSAEEGLAHLAQICSSCFLVGFSMGALLAIRLAVASKSRIHGLALLATPLFANRYKVRLLVPMVQIPFARAWLQKKAVSLSTSSLALRTDIPPAQASLAQLKWIVRGEAARVTQPAILIHSKADSVVPWENTLLLEKILSSHRKRTVVLHQSNHVLPLDLDRDRVVEEIANFFLNTRSS